MNNPEFLKSLVNRIPEILPLLNASVQEIIKAKQFTSYQQVRDDYWAKVYDVVEEYLTGDKSVTSFKNRMKKAASDAFVNAGELGYQDGGGELPLDDTTLEWLGRAQSDEFGYIDNLFDRLKQEWDKLDPIKEAFRRADSFAGGLDGVYNEARLRGMKNQVVMWKLGQTEKHCDTCLKLNGKRARISWFIKNNYIPRKPDAAMDCHGYNCDCSLVDKNGDEVTI